VSQEYYISKKGKTAGPCSLDDLRNYLAYGSLRSNDLVMRAGDSSWTPLRMLPEFQNEDEEAMVSQVTQRRRVARYRDYHKVPPALRSGVVIRRLLSGFLFFPPLLWQAASSVFQERIFRKVTDEHGFLKTWPRWVEKLVYPMLVLNAAVWLILIWTLTSRFMPILRELAGVFRDGMTDLRSWMGP
jgi:hypothetical protein